VREKSIHCSSGGRSKKKTYRKQRVPGVIVLNARERENNNKKWKKKWRKKKKKLLDSVVDSF